MAKNKNSFYGECQKISKLVEQCNANREAKLETSHQRFNFFTESNAKGLFAFGVYDYATKRYEMVDVFDSNLNSRIRRMHQLMSEFIKHEEDS